jgi:hypothetical protein
MGVLNWGAHFRSGLVGGGGFEPFFELGEKQIFDVGFGEVRGQDEAGGEIHAGGGLGAFAGFGDGLDGLVAHAEGVLDDEGVDPALFEVFDELFTCVDADELD